MRARCAHARALLAIACPVLVLLAAPAAAAAAARVAPAPSPMLIIEGAGDGHGVGMSQDGALELAEHGCSDAQILAHYYTGTAIGQAPTGHVVRVLVHGKVLRVPLEQYVRGVVAAEMPASWPAAALESQAIASRTYALTTDAGGSRFDVYADTRSQVYRGAQAETPQSNAAVAATAGQIVTYEGQPVVTYYFASSGGMTESIENSFIGAAAQPWLKAVPDPYETSASGWRVSMSMRSAAAHLAGLVKGTLLGIEVLKRGVSPRIVSAQLLGSRGDTLVSGPELESRLGLQSAWAYFSVASGAHVVREADLSGQASHATAVAPATAATSAAKAPQRTSRAPALPNATPQGGTEAPAASSTGGAPAS